MNDNSKGSPYSARGGNYNNRGQPPNNNNEIDDYLQDFKEKRKLLVRWNLYFPHENVKEFDVSENST